MAPSASATAAPLPERDWAELPHDVLSLIFKKLGALEVLYSAQAVCRAWNSAAADPVFWRCVDMRSHSCLFHKVRNHDAIAREAIDRAAGFLEEFYSEDFCTDDLLRYIGARTSILKSLRLLSCTLISKEGLIEILRRYPLLEELEVSFPSICPKLLDFVGQACLRLSCLRADNRYVEWYSFSDNSESDTGSFRFNLQALAIAKSMRQLRKLQMRDNEMTNKGLLAILVSCVHLESLDIRGCYNVKLDENLSSRLARIRDVRLPY